MALAAVGVPTSDALSTPSGASAELPPLSRGDARSRDLALVATAKGWTNDQAAEGDHAADIIGGIAAQVAMERPDAFVGSAVSSEPGGPPTLYVKGDTDRFIRDLVDKSGIDVIVADNQPFSFEELEARKLRVHHALAALGFRNVVTGVNIAGRGRIPATVSEQIGLPIEAKTILASLPDDLQSSVDLTISKAPVAVDMTSFGGMTVTKDGGSYATSISLTRPSGSRSTSRRAD